MRESAKFTLYGTDSGTTVGLLYTLPPSPSDPCLNGLINS